MFFSRFFLFVFDYDAVHSFTWLPVLGYSQNNTLCMRNIEDTLSSRVTFSCSHTQTENRISAPRHSSGLIIFPTSGLFSTVSVLLPTQCRQVNLPTLLERPTNGGCKNQSLPAQVTDHQKNVYQHLFVFVLEEVALYLISKCTPNRFFCSYQAGDPGSLISCTPPLCITKWIFFFPQ